MGHGHNQIKPGLFYIFRSFRPHVHGLHGHLMWTSSKAQSDFARLVVLFVIPFATKFGRSEEEAKTRLLGFSGHGI